MIGYNVFASVADQHHLKHTVVGDLTPKLGQNLACISRRQGKALDGNAFFMRSVAHLDLHRLDRNIPFRGIEQYTTHLRVVVLDLGTDGRERRGGRHNGLRDRDPLASCRDQLKHRQHDEQQ